MRIIFGMAGITILRGRLHICDRSSACMARWTVYRSVLSSELESNFAVVKIVTIAIDTIVTSQAVFAISLQVRIHKVRLNLLVAGDADRLVKLYITVDVAGFTCKRRTIGILLVSI
jgi:hypothetical protein